MTLVCNQENEQVASHGVLPSVIDPTPSVLHPCCRLAASSPKSRLAHEASFPTASEPRVGSPSLPLGESVTLKSGPHVTPKHDHVLHFDEIEHKYTMDGQECISVTRLLDQVFPCFDADKVLDQYYRGWQNPSNPKFKEYGGKTADEIKQIWDDRATEAKEKGTAMHKEIESMFLGEPSALDEPSMSGLRTFLREHSADLALGVLGVEVQLLSPSLRLAGTADFLARGITGSLTLVDWKRSTKDLRADGFAFGQKCGPPLQPEHDVPANTFHRYALQLNLYKRLLEDNYDFAGGPVDKLLIVQLHPSLPGAVRVVEVPEMPELVDCILSLRREVVRAEDEAQGAAMTGEEKVGTAECGAVDGEQSLGGGLPAGGAAAEEQGCNPEEKEVAQKEEALQESTGQDPNAEEEAERAVERSAAREASEEEEEEEEEVLARMEKACTLRDADEAWT